MKKFIPFVILVIALLIAGVVVKFKGNLNSLTKSSTNTNPPAEKEVALPKEELKKVNLEENSNLARFYQWTKEDPLFTSPDFNANAFLEVVKALEAEEKAFPKLTTPLFPISFLKETANVGRAHKNFLSYPSPETAEELIAGYYQLVTNYKKSADQLLTVLTNKILFPSEVDIFGFNNHTNLAIIKNDLVKLKLNTAELEKEIKRREKCFKKGKECQTPSLSFTKPIIKTSNIPFSKKDFLPSQISNPIRKSFKTFGPFAVSSSCFDWRNEFRARVQPFYVFEAMEERDFLKAGKKFLTQIEKLADFQYYRKVNKTGIDKIWLDKGLSRLYMNETNIYICRDSSYKTELAAIKNFYKNYKGSNLFKDLKSTEGPQELKDLIKDGSTLEKAFFEAEFPSDTAAENLTNYYAYTYKTIEELSKIYQNEPALNDLTKRRDEFLTRYLEYSRKLSDMPLVFATALGNFSSLRVKFTLYPESGNAYIYLYGGRSMYGLTYLPFSYSFYRLKDPLSYFEIKPVEQEFGLDKTNATYSQARGKYTDEQILKWHVNQAEMLEEEVKEYERSHPGVKL